jgi:hypothetical protein
MITWSMLAAEPGTRRSCDCPAVGFQAGQQPGGLALADGEGLAGIPPAAPGRTSSVARSLRSSVGLAAIAIPRRCLNYALVYQVVSVSLAVSLL